MSECKVCHRPLTSPASIQRGMGRKCADKSLEQFPSHHHAMNTRIIRAYDKVMKAEKSITPVIEQVAKSVGAKLEGLDFRIKTLESFARKIHTDISQGKQRDQAIQEIYDAVRYTMTKNGSEMVSSYQKVVANLENQGFKVYRVKNTWLNTKNPYKGINIVLSTDTGYRFELQFHTPQSLETKEKMHVLYEEARRTDTSAERVKELKTEMRNMALVLKVPTNISQIEERSEEL